MPAMDRSSTLLSLLPDYYNRFIVDPSILVNPTSAGICLVPSVLIHPWKAERGRSRPDVAAATPELLVTAEFAGA